MKTGDFIHLSNNEVIPADVVLLKSSDPQGLCYIDTCNIDGESNLKQRKVPRGMTDKVSTSDEGLNYQRYFSILD